MRLRKCALIVANPYMATVMALVAYSTITFLKGDFLASSRYNYFAYLADALLHGQLHFRTQPPTTHDLSMFEGRFYPYWPPFPAVLMIPAVWVWGLGVSDFLANNLIGALNVGVVAAVVRTGNDRGLLCMSDISRALLVVFFAFGTPHFVLAVGGGVWYTSQLVGFCATGLVYLIAIAANGTGAFVGAGCAVAAVLLTRPNAVLAAIWPAYHLLWSHRTRGARFLVRVSVLGVAPIVLGCAILAAYNYLRFGSPSDMGYRYHLMDPHFRAGYEEFGAFNVHYIPHNLFYHFIVYPLPVRPSSLEGGSLFLMSPLFVAMIWALLRPTATSWVLLGTCLATYVPIALLMGTGWEQWGPRYLLDFTLPMLLLVALGIARWPASVTGALVAISIAHYAIGVFIMH